MGFMWILDWIKVRRRVVCEILMMMCKNYLRNGYGRFCKCYWGFSGLGIGLIGMFGLEMGKIWAEIG